MSRRRLVSALHVLLPLSFLFLPSTLIAAPPPVVKANQTITFDQPGDVPFGTPAFPLTASSSSGLVVKLASQTTAVCSVSGNTVTLRNAGTCTVRASQSGNTSYNAAAPVDRSFAVAALPATVSFTGLTPTYTGKVITPKCVTDPVGLRVAITYSDAGSGLGRIDVGSYGVQCTVTAPGYVGAGEATLTIAKATQTISFTAIAAKTTAAAPFALTATATSKLPVSFTSQTPDVCAVSGGTVTIVGAGTCSITAMQGGNANYLAAVDVIRSFKVKTALTLTGLSQIFDGTQKSVGCDTVPAGLPTTITYKNLGSGIGRVNAGTYGVTCVLTDKTASIAGTLTIAKADQTITIGDVGGKKIGDAPFALTAIASSGLPVSLASTSPAVCTLVGNVVTLTAVGTCAIEASQAGDANHNAAPTATSSFVVSPVGPVMQYDDVYVSQLMGMWNVQNWDSADNPVLADVNAPAPAGIVGNAINVQYGPSGWGAFGLANMTDWNHVTPLYLNEYRTLDFDLFIDADTTGLDAVRFMLDDATYSNDPLLTSFIPGWDAAHPEASFGKWLHLTIDLHQIGAKIPKFMRFLFWNGSGARPHFRMANVRLGWMDDLMPPVITVQSVTPNLTFDQLTLKFSTDKDTIYKVEYGTSALSNVITGDANAWTQQHTVALNGVSRGNTYQYRITAWSHHRDPSVPPTPNTYDGSYTMPAAATSAPVISNFQATPNEIAVGSSTKLTWAAADYDTLTIDPGVGSVAQTPGATGVSVAPKTTTTYTITAANAFGSTTATVTVVTHAVPTITSFTSTPSKISAGQSTQLVWNIDQFDSVSIDHGVGNVTSVPGATGVSVSPTVTTTYVLTATNAYGTVRQTATVTIGATPVNPIWVMGYYIGYQRSLQQPNQVDYSAMTHIVVGAAVPMANGSLNTDFYIGATDGPAWAKETVQRAHAAGIKALLMLGGAGAVDGFRATANPAVRATLVANIKAFVEECGFDGVDIDWEPIDNVDKAPVTALVQALQAPGVLPRDPYIYTMPVGWNNSNYNPMADPFYGEISAYYDRVSTMSYSMLWVGDGWSSWHSSPLFGETPSTPDSIDNTVQVLLGAGVPASKINVGIGFYGTAYENGGWGASGWVHRAPPEIPAFVTDPNQNTNTAFIRYGDNQLSYSNIMQYIYSGVAYRWDPVARVPYLSFDTPSVVNVPAIGLYDLQTTYLTYDDEQGIAEKGAYVRSNQLGGAIIWSISQGYLGSWKTTGELDPLMKAVKAAFLGIGGIQ